MDIQTEIDLQASNASTVSASLTQRIDPTPLLRLSLMPEPGPATPGEPFTYTLTFGNVGSNSPSGVRLSMAVPEGASFVSATGGGSEQDGIVSWNIGLVPAARGGRLQVTVLPGETLMDGTLLDALAEIDPGATNEVVVRSSATTPVRAGSPLRLTYAVSQTATGAGDRLVFTLTATNTGPVDLLDVSASVLMPTSIASFSDTAEFFCPSITCDPSETAFWA
ncbi:MAG: hypothetical protein AAFP18_14445, partial [Bacteroidota bacterium]